MVDFAKLAAPFDPREISWRIGSMKKDKTAGMALAYIDARVVMDRLDAVCGPGGWQCRYSHTATKTVCDIAIKFGDEWLWKADGAGDSDIEAEKGALSDAFKRAAVRWGIGRYLYELPSPWVEVDEWKKIKTAEYKKLDQLLRQHTQAILNPPRGVLKAASQSIDDTKNEIAQMANESALIKTLLTAVQMADSPAALRDWWRENKETIDGLSQPDYDKLVKAAEDKRDSLTAIAA